MVGDIAKDFLTLSNFLVRGLETEQLAASNTYFNFFDDDEGKLKRQEAANILTQLVTRLGGFTARQDDAVDTVLQAWTMNDVEEAKKLIQRSFGQGRALLDIFDDDVKYVSYLILSSIWNYNNGIYRGYEILVFSGEQVTSHIMKKFSLDFSQPHLRELVLILKFFLEQDALQAAISLQFKENDIDGFLLIPMKIAQNLLPVLNSYAAKCKESINVGSLLNHLQSFKRDNKILHWSATKEKESTSSRSYRTIASFLVICGLMCAIIASKVFNLW